MNENKKREWVKNAIIIFLIIMLILTFFSNTIMNYSLPEVSARQVDRGTLSEQIRGSGTIEANQSYDVKIGETRTIASVEVKAGDTVEKGQTLFKLEDSESAELEAAEKTLRSAKKTYNEALLSVGYDYRADELDIEKQEEELALLKKELSNITDYQKAYEKAKDKVREIEGRIKELEKQQKTYDSALSAVSSEDYTSLGTEQYNKIKSAKLSLENAEKAKKESEDKLQSYENELGSGGNADSLRSARRAIESKQSEITKVEADLSMEYYKQNNGDSEANPAPLKAQLDGLQKELKYLEEDYSALLAQSGDYDRQKHLIDDARTTLKNKQASYDRAKRNLDDLIAEIKRDSKTKSEAVQDKIDAEKEKLAEAQSEESEAKDKAGMTVESQESKIRDAENALAKAKLSLSQQKEKDAVDASKYELNIQDLLDAVKDAEKEVEKYKSRSVGAEITANVAGKIASIAYAAGEEAAMGSTAAVIEMTEKGYTLEITATVEQAKKVRVGDEADVQYFYGDVSAVLQAIASDSSNPRNRILRFAVTGDVSPGQNLQISMGAKGQRYENIVPNSAVREDTNGKFILVVRAKSSPLGNRYIAERVDVEILASNDTVSAVNGDLLGGEFVVTTSTKPIEPGMQVRLVE